MVSRYAQTETEGTSGRRAGPAPSGGNPSGWVLFFIGCACMFVLGVLVGRNTAPVNFDMENLDNKLNQLQTSVLAEAEAVGEPLAAETLEDIPFDFYDKLRENPAAAADEPGGPTPLKRPRFEKKTPSDVVVALADVKTANDAAMDATPVLKPAVKPPAEEYTAAPPEPARAAPKADFRPAPETPAASGPGYAIQVASLRDTGKAETVRDKFRSKGYPAYTQQAVVEGKGQWCRVRLGPYPDKIQAQNDLSRLQKAGVDAILFLIETNSNQ